MKGLAIVAIRSDLCGTSEFEQIGIKGKTASAGP